MSPLDDFTSLCMKDRPEVFLVLGSGMGPLIRRVQALASLPFADITDLTASSVVGHRGRLTLGRWAGRRMLVSEGRLHYYEGHSWDVVTAPIRLAANLGVRQAILTNRAAGLSETTLNHEEVLATAAATAEKLADVLESLLGMM